MVELNAVADVSTTCFDLAIIGSGIVGSIAAALAIDSIPGIRVILLDDSSQATASQLSLAVDAFSSESPARQRLAVESLALGDRVRAYCPAYGERSAPALWIVETGDVQRVQSTLPYPLVQADPHVLDSIGIRVPDDSAVFTSKPVAFSDATAVLRQAWNLVSGTTGCAALRNFSVAAVEEKPDELQLRSSSGVTVRARKALVATGAGAISSGWSNFGTSLVGARLKRVVSTQILTPFKSLGGCVFFESEDAFLRPSLRAKNAAWLSIRGTEWLRVSDASQDNAPRPSEEAEVLRILNRFLPAVSRTTYRYQIGTELFSASGDPIVGVHGRVSYAIAGSGSGFRLAPGMASAALALAQLV